jgi:hypothetical protein
MSYQLPPEPPKRALCAFFLYRMDIFDEIKHEKKDLPITEITKIIAEMWKMLEPNLKKRYEDEYQINKRTVAEERRLYEEEFGRQVKSRRSKKVRRALGQIRKYFDRDFG